MVQINFARREVNCKIVYYGPGMSGKTTNLEKVFENAPDEHKGDLTSIATEGDRTLFFDFLPLDLGTVAGMNTKFQLYTVPGQVYYNSTRKLVLQGADGIVFVADSQKKKMEENIESLENLIENLAEYNLSVDEIPVVMQWNKRDMPDISSKEELESKLNPRGWASFDAVAVTGEGVFPTLKALSGLVLENLNKEYGMAGEDGAPKATPAKPKAAPKPAPGKPRPKTAPTRKPKTAQRPAPKPQTKSRPAPAPKPNRPAPPPTPAPKPPPKPKATPPKPAPIQRGGPRAPKPPPPPQKQSSNNLVYVIILILIIAAAAAAAVMFFPGES
ncbi:MAG: GTP-binding protein [Planctomycetota bacterium]|jgi:signal recognition particle receptor subunit beta